MDYATVKNVDNSSQSNLDFYPIGFHQNWSMSIFHFRTYPFEVRHSRNPIFNFAKVQQFSFRFLPPFSSTLYSVVLFSLSLCCFDFFFNCLDNFFFCTTLLQDSSSSFSSLLILSSNCFHSIDEVGIDFCFRVF